MPLWLPFSDDHQIFTDQPNQHIRFLFIFPFPLLILLSWFRPSDCCLPQVLQTLKSLEYFSQYPCFFSRDLGSILRRVLRSIFFFFFKNLILFSVYFLAAPHSIWGPRPRPGIGPLAPAWEVHSSFGLLPKPLATVFPTGDPNFRQI